MAKKRIITPEELEAAHALWTEHRVLTGRGARQVVYNYVPNWLKVVMPTLYGTDKVEDPIVWLKLFLPGSRWTFYATEFSDVAPDGYPEMMFGYLISALGPDCDELCYLPLASVREINESFRFQVERDLWWTPSLLSRVMDSDRPRL